MEVEELHGEGGWGWSWGFFFHVDFPEALGVDGAAEEEVDDGVGGIVVGEDVGTDAGDEEEDPEVEEEAAEEFGPGHGVPVDGLDEAEELGGGPEGFEEGRAGIGAVMEAEEVG